MEIIKVDHITKDYGNGKGVFDVSFSVRHGEVMGFLGPNGAGKTTTIRQLMGFIRPDSGEVSILGMDCFADAAAIAPKLGYLPGEIAFIENMRGLEFIRFIAKMKKLRDLTRAEELMERFRLDPRGKIRKMSKGMKQKIGIVCCFMQDPDFYILDEPTGGLDPLMQNTFIDLILEEKAKGKTILMSSHLSEEVERTCDRTAMIREGKLVAVEDMASLRQNRNPLTEVKFLRIADAAAFAGAHLGAVQKGNAVTLHVTGGMDGFIKELGKYGVEDLEMKAQSLEELFMHYYGEEAAHE